MIENIKAAILTSAAALGYHKLTSEVVKSFISDSLVSLPTGSRKSLVLPGAFNVLKQTDSSVVLAR